jgi:hypothetical protein
MSFDVEDEEVQPNDPGFVDELGIGDCPHVVVHEAATILDKLGKVAGLVGEAAVTEVLPVLRRNHMSELRPP